MTSFLINEPPFQVQPSLAGAIGFNEAAVVQVLHYWLNCGEGTVFKEGQHWVLNLCDRLQECFFFWYRDEISYMVAELGQCGILMELPENKREQGDSTYHTINYHTLEQMVSRSHIAVPSVLENASLPDHANANANANANKWLPFTAEVQNKGQNLYVLVTQDAAHCLSCELALEIQKKGGQKGSKEIEVICHFPVIMDGQLKEKIGHDLTLHGVIMIGFHLKFMEQLLQFCIDHQAKSLSLFADDDQADGLEIYRQFLAQQDQSIPTPPHGATLAFPISQGIVRDWKGFMDLMASKFRQALWREQKGNPMIQNYLRQLLPQET